MLCVPSIKRVKKQMEATLIDNSHIKFGDNIFDLLRLWAILQVTIGHLQQHLQASLPMTINVFFGFPGVVVLFAISGFLVTASFDRLMDREKGVLLYVKKRVCRIFPGLWISIIVSSVCIMMVYSRRPTMSEGLIYALTQFFGCNFYTGDWLRGYGVGAPNGSLWTICVELQFYILIMLVWKWLKQQRVYTWMLSIVVGICINIISGKWGGISDSITYKLFSVTVLPYLYMFLIGAMAYRYFDTFVLFVRKYRILLIVGLFVMMQIGNRYVPIGEYVNILSGVCLASLTCVLAYALGRKVRLPFDISYGIYLYHMIIVNVLVELGTIGEMRYFMWALLGSVGGGFVSWYVVEKRWLVREKCRKKIITN